MPPLLATFVYVGFAAWLFRRDLRQRPNITGAVWYVFFWVVISGGLFVSDWMNIFGLSLGGSSVEEGSPLDALVFFVLIFGGLYTLSRRRVSWGEFFRQNPWVALYLGYCLVACFWSDFPLVAAKRWFKLFGQPIMVLLILTEPDPLESFTRLMKRCSYIIVFVSVLFIKYYPQYGRAFDPWSGMGMNTGMTTNKNTLGCDCFILALFFVWHLFRVWKQDPGKERKWELFWTCFMLGWLTWLLYMAHSSTSIGVLILALALMGFVSLKSINRSQIWVYLLVIVTVLGLLEVTCDLHKHMIALLGRNTTLTGRTDIWAILTHWDVNPLLGVGFESFWLGVRVDQIADLLGGLRINEAHNGYLETYINLGGLGLALTFAMLIVTFLKAQRDLTLNFHYGRFRLAYLAAFIVYNWTEAAFRTHCVPFFIFFLVAIDYSRPEAEQLPEWRPSAIHKPDNLSPNESLV
jgi:O-antigen ligase